ncbi:sporulation protein, partial [Halopiger djelfimassiliensis]|uniref:sporulation protein n=1 Tax=Halopiger djelfimassiliensis TaxID=1293047 RepID=UPI000677E2FF
MKRILSSLGIGAATVDTVLPTTLTAGETVDVSGGNDSQEIDGIYRRGRPSASGLDPEGEGRKPH